MFGAIEAGGTKMVVAIGDGDGNIIKTQFVSFGILPAHYRFVCGWVGTYGDGDSIDLFHEIGTYYGYLPRQRRMTIIVK